MNTDRFAIPLAIVIAGLIIGGALYFSNLRVVNISKNSNSQTASTNIRKVDDTDHILGNPNADILIVEYSDTECPYCKIFHNTLHQIINEYGANGKVAWVYRHFPIVELHPKAEKEAEATECVASIGGQTKFWEFLNMIYDNTPSNNGLDSTQLPVFAKSVGIDSSAFNTCLSDGKFTAKVAADYADAIKSGGQGTPHSVIITKDGTQTVLDGAYPYAQLKTIIDTLLQK